MSGDWVFMRHSETHGETRVPDNTGVVEWHEAHGWERAHDPESAVPEPDDPEPDDADKKPAKKAPAKKAAAKPADDKDEE